MKTLLLHDYLNPTRVVVLNTADLIAEPYLSGSAVYVNGISEPVLVRETPEEVAILLGAK